MKCEKCKKRISEDEVAGGNHFWSRYYCKDCWKELYPENIKKKTLLEDYLPVLRRK